MALNEQTVALLEKLRNAENMKNLGDSNTSLSVEGIRRNGEAIFDAFAPPGSAVTREEEISVRGERGEIAARLYWPEESVSDKLLPGFVYAHGGGFVAGDLDGHEGWARSFCAISGDSAGGNIAAAVALNSRDNDTLNVAAQFFMCTVFSIDEGYSPNSRMYLGDLGFAPSNAPIERVSNPYVRSPEDRKSPLTSMLQVDDLSGLPPAISITAGYCTLRSEGEEHAERLRDAGVPVTYKYFEGTIHGFYIFRSALDQATEVVDYLASEARKILH